MFSQRPISAVQFASPNIEELTGISRSWTLRPQLFWSWSMRRCLELQQQFKRAAQTGQAVTNTYRIRHALTGRVAYILEGRQPAMSRNGLLLGYEVVWLDVTRQTIAERRLSSPPGRRLAVLTLAWRMTSPTSSPGSILERTVPGTGRRRHPFHEVWRSSKKNSLQPASWSSAWSICTSANRRAHFHNLNDITTNLWS